MNYGPDGDRKATSVHQITFSESDWQVFVRDGDMSTRIAEDIAAILLLPVDQIQVRTISVNGVVEVAVSRNASQALDDNVVNSLLLAGQYPKTSTRYVTVTGRNVTVFPVTTFTIASSSRKAEPRPDCDTTCIIIISCSAGGVVCVCCCSCWWFAWWRRQRRKRDERDAAIAAKALADAQPPPEPLPVILPPRHRYTGVSHVDYDPTVDGVQKLPPEDDELPPDTAEADDTSDSSGDNGLDVPDDDKGIGNAPFAVRSTNEPFPDDMEDIEGDDDSTEDDEEGDDAGSKEPVQAKTGTLPSHSSATSPPVLSSRSAVRPSQPRPPTEVAVGGAPPTWVLDPNQTSDDIEDSSSDIDDDGEVPQELDDVFVVGHAPYRPMEDDSLWTMNDDWGGSMNPEAYTTENRPRDEALDTFVVHIEDYA